MSETSYVEIATDGACKGNPGPGGWGVLLRAGKTEKELSGGDDLLDFAHDQRRETLGGFVE